ncbi:hypothetical protein BDV18DRAFT_133720 [Aspergillus unguis]
MGSSLSTPLSTLPPLRDFIVPTPEAYVILLNVFQYFPLVTTIEWLTSWWPAGKTSSKQPTLFNLPGRLAWFLMEIVGPLNLLYILTNLAPKLNMATLPLPNKLVASLYVLHYINRAIISPFFSAPAMSPIHIFVAGSAMIFNWFNSTCLAAWLVGYNVTTLPGYYPPSPLGDATPEKVLEDSLASTTGTSLLLPGVGLGLFVLGMVGNISSERRLHRLRREAADAKKPKDDDSTVTLTKSDSDSGNKYHKVYIIPPANGLFSTILYPHYVFEWLEWIGFALVGTTIFPTLSPPSLIPDVLSTAFSGTTASIAGTAISGTSPPLRLAPWLIPAVWAAGKLRVPVLPLPAIVFVVNAVANMLPHARWGRKWYVEKFGEERVAGRGAVLPFVSWM